MKLDLDSQFELSGCPYCGIPMLISRQIRAEQESNDDPKDEDDPEANAADGVWCPNGHRSKFDYCPTVEKSALDEAIDAVKARDEVTKAKEELMHLRHDREQLEAEILALRSGEKIPNPKEQTNPPKRGRGRPRRVQPGQEAQE